MAGKNAGDKHASAVTIVSCSEDITSSFAQHELHAQVCVSQHTHCSTSILLPVTTAPYTGKKFGERTTKGQMNIVALKQVTYSGLSHT